MQLNTGTMADWHRDDLGEAILIVVGDSVGGEVVVEDSGPIAAKHLVLRFDTGLRHRSFSFVGERHPFLFYMGPREGIEDKRITEELRILAFDVSGVTTETRTNRGEEERTLTGQRSRWPGTGQGSPLMAPGRRGRREAHDGAGLCSPGRWRREERVFGDDPLKQVRELFTDSLREWDGELRQSHPPSSLRRVLYGLATGGDQSNPCPQNLLDRCERGVDDWLRAQGKHPEPRGGDVAQKIRVRRLQALLEIARDPDSSFANVLAEGVPVGVGVTMPRTPEVYEEKRRWKLPELEGFESPKDMKNYPSARARPDYLRSHFEEEQREGLMVEVDEQVARDRYGTKLCIAALGAIAKDPEGTSFRIIHDGTHGVLVNHQIRPRDQVRLPVVGDIQAVLHEISEEKQGHFVLLYDVQKAHRVIPVREEDWGYQACKIEEPQSEPGQGKVWLNKVGTFGVGSASYWWARAAACVVRLGHHVAASARPVWHLLYADDGSLYDTAEDAPESMLLQLLVMYVAGIPIAWTKVRGGVEANFVGYALDVRHFEVGLSSSRASWLVDWLNKKVEDGRVDTGELRECLGRLSFAGGPILWIRPFLGPLYSWVAACPMHRLLPIPPMIKLVMRYVVNILEARRMIPCQILYPNEIGELFRVDAKAEGDVVCLGGWALDKGTDTRLAQRFSLRLDAASFPWAFEVEPYRRIASFELLAVLIAVMVLPGVGRRGASCLGSAGLVGGTDNQGNTKLIDKYMTTKFPLCTVLMELSAQTQARSLTLSLGWLPREANQPADDLTNENFAQFAPELRVQVDWGKLGFLVLDDLLREGKRFQEELRTAKESRAIAAGPPGGSVPQSRVGGRGRLRDREPW